MQTKSQSQPDFKACDSMNTDVEPKKELTCGIIGGLGPEATLNFM